MDGYYSMGLSGLAITLEPNGENVQYELVGTDNNSCVHRSKIYYTANGRAFFMAFGKRVHLDECLRAKI